MLKKLKTDILPHLDKYINQKCIEVDIIVDNNIALYFGEFVLLSDKVIKNKAGKILLTTEYRFEFEWRWTIYENNRIIASSRMSNDSEYFKAQNAIQIIKNKVLIEYDYNSKTNELVLIFEGDLMLRSFNDVVPGLVNSAITDCCIFIAWGPTEYFAALTNGKIENKSRTVTYVHDYAERKDEYRF